MEPTKRCISNTIPANFLAKKLFCARVPACVQYTPNRLQTTEMRRTDPSRACVALSPWKISRAGSRGPVRRTSTVEKRASGGMVGYTKLDINPATVDTVQSTSYHPSNSHKALPVPLCTKKMSMLFKHRYFCLL